MSKLTAVLLVLLSTLFWGINFHAGKYVVGYISPLDGAAIRFSLASMVIFIMLFVKESPMTIWMAQSKLAGVCSAVAYGFIWHCTVLFILELRDYLFRHQPNCNLFGCGSFRTTPLLDLSVSYN